MEQTHSSTDNFFQQLINEDATSVYAEQTINSQQDCSAATAAEDDEFFPPPVDNSSQPKTEMLEKEIQDTNLDLTITTVTPQMVSIIIL